jgi:hypothetical protein
MNRKSVLFVVAGVALCLAIVLAASFWASSAPDGLDRVLHDPEARAWRPNLDEDGKAREGAEESEPVWDKPLAPDYKLELVQDEPAQTALAGILGVAITLSFTLLLGWFLRRRNAV